MWLTKIIGQIKVIRQWTITDAKAIGLRKSFTLLVRINVYNIDE